MEMKKKMKMKMKIGMDMEIERAGCGLLYMLPIIEPFQSGKYRYQSIVGTLVSFWCSLVIIHQYYSFSSEFKAFNQESCFILVNSLKFLWGVGSYISKRMRILVTLVILDLG
jgi:hypothetical protein